MEVLGARTRSRLQLPRVEFDLSALFLGAAGYAAYRWSWDALASFLRPVVVDAEGKERFAEGGELLREFWGHVLHWVQLPYLERLLADFGWARTAFQDEGGKGAFSLDTHGLELPWWHFVVIAMWLLVLWSLVGGGLARIHAVRIARDESIGVFDALAFVGGNLKGFLMAPFFVLGAAAFFFLLTTLVGAVGAIPAVGPFLLIVAHPLGLLAGIVVTVIAIGLVFGYPITQAALSTERNGTLDAISRTFSYLFTRPVVFVVGVVVIFVVADLLLGFGGWFVVRTSQAVALGAVWDASTQQALTAGATAGVNLAWISAPPGQSVPTAAYVSWFWTYLATLLVHGWVLAYVIGGLTDVYFMLRGEVDGIADTEVFVEGETAELGEPLPGEPSKP